MVRARILQANPIFRPFFLHSPVQPDAQRLLNTQALEYNKEPAAWSVLAFPADLRPGGFFLLDIIGLVCQSVLNQLVWFLSSHGKSASKLQPKEVIGQGHVTVRG
jgi:hypothetical protein